MGKFWVEQLYNTRRVVQMQRQEFFLQHISFLQRTHPEQVVCFFYALQIRAQVKDLCARRADCVDFDGCFGYATVTPTVLLAAGHASDDCRDRRFVPRAVVHTASREGDGFKALHRSGAL
jgi:hypothetical protein